MADNIEKIANSELEKLGSTKEEPKQKTLHLPPKKSRSTIGSPGGYRTTPRPGDLFSSMKGEMDADKEDLMDIPDFLVRPVDPPTLEEVEDKVNTIRTGRSTPQKQDAICAEMERIASKWKHDKKATEVPVGDLKHITAILVTNVGNIIEHGGLIYKTDRAPDNLGAMLKKWLEHECKVRDGDEYREMKVVK